jgi:hypothetical protein
LKIELKTQNPIYKWWFESARGPSLGPLSTDSSGQLDIFGHDGDALGVDGAQVGVLEQADKVSLRGFLKNVVKS